jgi:hypothetical protein
MTRYRTDRPDPSVYRPPAGRSLAERAAEQDAAAGSRNGRLLLREDGAAVLASVALRCYRNSRRVYAYLRWTAQSGTRELYLGDVSDSPDRGAALQAAWRLAHSTQAMQQPSPTPS